MRLSLLRLVARVGKGLRRLGLGGLNHFGAAVARRTAGKTLAVEAHGLRLGASFDSWSLLRQIRDGEFEPFTVRLFASLLRPGMTVVDVGACIGLYSVLAAKVVGDEGVVYAFEPDARNQRDLRENVRGNGVRNVLVVPKAASDRAGVASFYVRRPAGHSGLHAARGGFLAAGAVESIPADDVLRGQSLGVVKIDAEGHELSVLRGMERTLERSPDAKLFIELAPDTLRAAGTSGEELVSALRRHFGEIFEIDEVGQRLLPLGDGAPTRTCNLLCRAPVTTEPGPA